MEILMIYDLIKWRARAMVVAVLIIICGTYVSAQNQESFINLSVNDGLSQSTICNMERNECYSPDRISFCGRNRSRQPDGALFISLN